MLDCCFVQGFGPIEEELQEDDMQDQNQALEGLFEGKVHEDIEENF